MPYKSSVIFLLCLLLTTCAVFPAENETVKAAESLTQFFQDLADGDYARADELYGGDYEVLQSMNPQIQAEDREALWQNGCAMNGLQCLPVLRIVSSQVTAEGEYSLVVEFKKPDGGIFVFGPCCGASETEMPPVSQFEYHVVKSDGRFLIQDLPVFDP